MKLSEPQTRQYSIQFLVKPWLLADMVAPLGMRTNVMCSSSSYTIALFKTIFHEKTTKNKQHIATVRNSCQVTKNLPESDSTAGSEPRNCLLDRII